MVEHDEILIQCASKKLSLVETAIVLKRDDLKAIKRRARLLRLHIDYNSNKTYFCKECGSFKLEDNFYTLKKCKNCQRSEKIIKLNNDPYKCFRSKFLKARNRSRRAKVPFLITEDYLWNIFSRQGFNCFYTSFPVRLAFGCGVQEDAMSFDRVVPDFGYKEGNIVICQLRVNAMKHNANLDELKMWMPSWFDRIVECDWLTLVRSKLDSINGKTACVASS